MVFGRCTKYSGEQLSQIAFPLGGIGTGCISVSGTGALVEWQIKNRPALHTMNRHTFAALRVCPRGEPDAAVTRVVESPLGPPYNKHPRTVDGVYYQESGLGDVFGLPRMKRAVFCGAYPFCKMKFEDDRLPVSVEMEAWNPMIPLNEEDSGIPIAVLNYRMTNEADTAMDLGLMLSAASPLAETKEGGRRNTFVSRETWRGIVYDNAIMDESDPEYGQVLIATPWKEGFHRSHWHRLGWFDPLQLAWDEFSKKGTLSENCYDDHPPGYKATASLGANAVLGPGESATIPFWITWCFPVTEYPFGEVKIEGVGSGVREKGKPRWKTWYANRFPTAESVADYFCDHQQRLFEETSRFRAALEESSIDEAVLDAVSSQMAILRTPTVIYLKDGTPYGYEGCGTGQGCCPGSCNHVWNYAQAPDFLYPELMKRMHEKHFKYNASPSGSGGMAFRVRVPLCCVENVPKPAVDGQLGTLIHVYQLWRLTGDDEWLRQIWPAVKLSLEYAWKYWDYNRRGVIEGVHHNTYDIEFHGPNPMAQSYYVGALQACAEMAEHLGEGEKANDYRNLAQRGAEWLKECSFNGEYYVQYMDRDAWRHSEVPIDPPKREVPQMAEGEPKWQFGSGCLSDQLVGEWLATVAGLPSLLDDGERRSALKAIYTYNLKQPLSEHANCQRAFALNDESGVVLCSWPKGGRPILPFIYCDEVWTGIEYQVAAHLMYEGLEEESREIVCHVRSRYDGMRRNPWCEMECGGYYARAMSSWSLLTAASGFQADAGAQRLTFRYSREPKTFFWSTGSAWGRIALSPQRVLLLVHWGRITVSSIQLREHPAGTEWCLKGSPCLASDEGVIAFPKAAELTAGEGIELLSRSQPVDG